MPHGTERPISATTGVDAEKVYKESLTIWLSVENSWEDHRVPVVGDSLDIRGAGRLLISLGIPVTTTQWIPENSLLGVS